MGFTERGDWVEGAFFESVEMDFLVGDGGVQQMPQPPLQFSQPNVHQNCKVP